MSSRRRASAALAVGLALLGLRGQEVGASAPPVSVQEAAGAQIELAAQTPVVAPGGTFTVGLRLADIPADGRIKITVHQRVRSRSELAQSMDGDGLRSEVISTAIPLTSLATDPDGTRILVLSLDPATGGLLLPTEGVYPVALVAQDSSGTALATLITHLIVPPEEGDDAPPLGVAVVPELGAPPALQPDGTIQLDRAAVDEMAELVAGLVAVPDVPATLAVQPETVEALTESPVASDAELVAALRQAAADRTVMALPYVNVSPDDLAAASLLGELGPQIERGRQVLTGTLAIEPTASVRMAPPDLGSDGLAALAFSGVRRVVVADDQVAPLDSGILRFSLAQPFLLQVPGGTPRPAGPGLIQAMATDPVMLDRLATKGSPALVASRVLAELALLRLEQPSVARSAVIPLGAGTPALVVEHLLEGLDAGPPFAPMSLNEAFDHAMPLLDGGGNRVDRRLLPRTATPMRSADARALTAARSHLDTFVGLLGDDATRSDPLARQLLIATGSGLSATERRGHVAAVETAIEEVTSEVTAPATFTLTLTAREGTIPLTIRNGSGVPLHVSIRLRSQKLDFPEGDTIERVLTGETTRIDIAVRTRATGAFPLEVDVRSPDGQQSLAMTRYTVRSTAVSGAGLVLSVGAGLFLVVWWARHWRRTRRSDRLVAANGHPSDGG